MGGSRRRRLLPIDPRPSRADPEARRVRKELEKEHGYEWVPPVVLALLGIGLAYDVTKDVAKHEERHKREEEEEAAAAREAEAEARRRRRRERERGSRHGSRRRSRPRGDDDGEDGDDDDDEEERGDERDRLRRRWRRDRGVSAGERDAAGDSRALVAARDPEGLERDGGLGRADRLERGEGGWDRRRARGRGAVGTGYDSSYDERDDGGRHRRRRYYDEDEDEDEYEGRDGADFDYEYIRGRRDLEDRSRGRRPLPRRRSSDW